MKIQSQRRHLPFGFTLIELLVVIAIIAILAGLLVPAVGMMNKKKILARARGQLAELSTGIDRYQQKKGFYPPDVAGKPSTNQLLYELWGALAPTNNNPVFYLDFGQGENISATTLQNIFGTQAILNSSVEKKEVDNFIATFKPDKVKNINTAADPVWSFYSPSKGPNDITDVNGAMVNLVNYVSSAPKHNANTYDLWIDVLIGGTIYRVSNWSSEPEKNVVPY